MFTQIKVNLFVCVRTHTSKFETRRNLKDLVSININTEKRLEEIEKKLDDLHNEISKQQNRTNYKPLFIVLLVLSAILIFLVLIGIMSFFTI